MLAAELSFPCESDDALGHRSNACREGRTLDGKYRLLRQLAEGGMGCVFEAEHVRTRRRVAIKTLARRHVSQPEAIKRFEREAWLSSRLHHRHIVAALDFGTSSRPVPYIVLELLHGETLEERLRARAPLPLEEAAEIARQVGAALASAHRAGIVHCDVKPSNVFLTELPDSAPFVKLLDFGISKDLTYPDATADPAWVSGTPEYMAPEQLTGYSVAVDERTDQWALGVLVYEMLTGERPFSRRGRSHPRALAPEVLAASSQVHGVPPAVDAVLKRALSRLSAGRYRNIAEFSDALAAAAHSEREWSAGGPASFQPPSRVRLKTMPSLAPLAPERRPTREAIELDRPALVPPWQARSTENPTWDAPGSGIDENIDAPDPLRRVLLSLGRARAALKAGEVVEATAHAEAALRHADHYQDAAGAELARLSGPLVTQIFTRRLGSTSRRAVPTPEAQTNEPMSPRAAQLLDRIQPGMRVSDILAASSLTELETLRELVHLVSLKALVLR
jgi:serine/threonine protein kinase